MITEFINSQIEEIKNITFMFKRNQAQILNYFIAKETNAKAEALNQNLQCFVNVNYGARNTDLFLYRIKHTSHSASKQELANKANLYKLYFSKNT